MKNKIKIPKLLQRIGAALMACFIFSYSLLTASLFGVGAVSLSDKVNWDKYGNFITSLVSAVWRKVGGPINPVLGAIGSSIINLTAPTVELLVDDTQATVVNKIANGTYSMNGRYTYKGVTDKLCTLYSYQIDSSYKSNQNSHGIFISDVVVAEDYSISVHVAPDPDWDFINGENYIELVTSISQGSNPYIQLAFYPRTSSGSVPFVPHPINVTIIIYGFDSSGNQVMLGSKSMVYNHNSLLLRFSFSGNSNQIIIPTNILDNFTLRDNSLSPSIVLEGICGSFIPKSVTIVRNEIPYLPESYILNDFDSYVNFYNDYVRNYVQNTFVDYPDIVNQFIYYDIENPPTEPTDETITPTGSTGNGTVVIIDPFTLPPEWLEDNAELDTDHYVLDSDQWESPLEIIAQYKQQISLAELGEDDPFWQAGELSAPVSVTNAMYAFQYMGYELLLKSGLLVVLASLVGFGIIVRFISLK